MAEDSPQPINHDVIVFQLGELKGLMMGMNQRLETANGRTAKMEGKVEILEKRADNQDGAVKALSEKKNNSVNIWSVVIAGSGVLVAVIALFAKFGA